MWKCRTVENEENQNQASLVFHRPWKSLRDSHIPTTPTTILPFPNQNQKTRKEPQLRRKPQPPSLGSSFDEKMLGARPVVLSSLSVENKYSELQSGGRGWYHHSPALGPRSEASQAHPSSGPDAASCGSAGGQLDSQSRVKRSGHKARVEETPRRSRLDHR